MITCISDILLLNRDVYRQVRVRSEKCVYVPKLPKCLSWLFFASHAYLPELTVEVVGRYTYSISPNVFVPLFSWLHLPHTPCNNNTSNLS